MPLGDYLAGLAFLIATLGGSLGAAALLVRRRLGHLRGAARAVAFALLATAAVVAVHLLPGAVGALSRWSVALLALALLAAAWQLPRRHGAPEPAPPPEVASGALSWVLAGGAAGALALWGLTTAWNRTVLAPIGVDSMTFHLPEIARWIQEGTLWQVNQYAPLLAPGNYPHNGDLVFLAVVLPWRSDAFTGLVNPVFVGLVGLAAYAIATELRAPRATAVLAGAVVASLPSVIVPAFFDTMTDAIMLACFGGGALFLIRHARTRRTSDLVLGGLGLGLAFGTKWYGTLDVVVALAVWAAAWLVAARAPRAVARRGLALGALAAAAGGFWLVRNLVESGNPVQPANVEIAGVTLFDAPRDIIRECGGFSVAHYLDSPGVVADYLAPAWWSGFALAGPLLAAGLVLAAGAAVLALRRREADAGRRAAVVAGALALLGAYAVTPDSAFGQEGEPLLAAANTRYATPALLLAAAALAWAAGRVGRVRLLIEAVAAAAVVHGMVRGFDARPAVVAGVAGGLALAAGATWAALRATRRVRAGLALVAAVVVVAVGYARQDEYHDRRYQGQDPVLEWLVENAREGHKVGIAGVHSLEGLSPVLPAFGPRYENEVHYVGPTVDGQLREYASRAEWARAIREGGYDLLVVGRGGYGEGCDVPGRESDDDAWARLEGFRQIARADHLTLYAVP